MIDFTDKELLRLLEKDARQSSKKIALQLNMSSATVRRRLRRLTENDILRIVAAINPIKSGLPVCAIIAFDAAYQNLDEVMETLAKQEEIKSCHVTPPF